MSSPTLSTSSGPGGRFDTSARAFVPNATRHKMITIRNVDGTEINLESLKKHSPQPSSVPIAAPSPITTGRRMASVRIESEEDKRKRQTRLQEKVTTERMREAAEEMERQRFEEAERKDKKAVRIDEELCRLVERLKEVTAKLDLEPSGEGEVIENGVSEQPVNGANKSLKQKESLRIDTSESAKRRLIPLDINAAKKNSSSPPLSALMTARNIDRLDEIEYPQGIKNPTTELNQNAKDGKFR